MNTNEQSTLEPLHGEEKDASANRRMLSPEEGEGVSDTRAALDARWIVPRRKPEPAVENSDKAPPPSLIPLPPMRLYPERFQALQRFEGTVLCVSEDSFTARLVDKTNRRPQEEAEFPLVEVMPGDQDLVRPGAVFYWVIGYERKTYGQQSRSSIIRFRRLPTWTQSEIDNAKDAAKTFLSFLDLNGANEPT